MIYLWVNTKLSSVLIFHGSPTPFLHDISVSEKDPPRTFLYQGIPTKDISISGKHSPRTFLYQGIPTKDISILRKHPPRSFLYQGNTHQGTQDILISVKDPPMYLDISLSGEHPRRRFVYDNNIMYVLYSLLKNLWCMSLRYDLIDDHFTNQRLTITHFAPSIILTYHLHFTLANILHFAVHQYTSSISYLARYVRTLEIYFRVGYM